MQRETVATLIPRPRPDPALRQVCRPLSRESACRTCHQACSGRSIGLAQPRRPDPRRLRGKDMCDSVQEDQSSLHRDRTGIDPLGPRAAIGARSAAPRPDRIRTAQLVNVDPGCSVEARNSRELAARRRLGACRGPCRHRDLAATAPAAGESDARERVRSGPDTSLGSC